MTLKLEASDDNWGAGPVAPPPARSGGSGSHVRLPGEAVIGLWALEDLGEAEGPLLGKSASVEQAHYHSLWGRR